MRARWNQHDVALRLAAIAVVRVDRHQAGKLTLSAGIRLQRDGSETRDPAQRLLELVEHLRVPTRLLEGHEWMHPRELRPADRDHL